ncbi:MAG: WbqC family protein [Bacteroidales bacterium]
MQNGVINTCLLSTAYFPPIEYFIAIANSNATLIELEETYQKQSYRTRCHINSGNGLLVLTVPVLRDKGDHKIPIKEIKIDYSKPWILQHKRAIEAAYMSSPFFEYYVDDIFPILDKKEPFLFNLNSSIISAIISLIGLKNNISFTDNYIKTQNEGILDLREQIHPKHRGASLLQKMEIEKPYYQVFTNKQGFIPNLSILDLLFNEGPNSISFLKR